MAVAADSASDGVNTAIVLAMAGLEPGTEAEGEMQAAPIRMPERYNVLVACKRERTLYVYERGARGTWSKLVSFPMAFGRKEGDKADAGDRRTPEGRYWITSVLSGPSQGPLYGPLVFTLNYPTPRDLAEGKSGEGIWIHGVEFGKHPNYTRGCLSLENVQVGMQPLTGTAVLHGHAVSRPRMTAQSLADLLRKLIAAHITRLAPPTGPNCASGSCPPSATR